MGYSNKESMVRVDVFKSSGKWYETIAIDMGKVFTIQFVHDAVRMCIKEQTLYGANMDSYIFICLEPYHQSAHPVLLKKTDNG